MKKALLLSAALAATACAARPRAKVDVGAAPEAVESLLGRPDRVFTRTTAKEKLSVWSWRRYWQLADVGDAPKDRGNCPESLASLRDDEAVRIVFRDGKAESVETRETSP